MIIEWDAQDNHESQDNSEIDGDPNSNRSIQHTVPDDDAHYPAYCQISEGSYRLYRCFSFVMNWMMNGDDDMHRDDRQLNGDYNHHHSRH